MHWIQWVKKWFKVIVVFSLVVLIGIVGLVVIIGIVCLLSGLIMWGSNEIYYFLGGI